MPVAKADRPLVPHFAVLINGVPLPVEAVGYVAGVTVDESVELPSMFTLAMTSSDAQHQAVPWIDDAQLFAIGHVVEIKLGYVDDLETLLIGEITALEPEFVFNRLPRLTVRGYDRRHRLQRGRKTRTFVQKTDSDIAIQIAHEVGLTPQAVDSRVIHSYILQANQTDMDFLQERARRIQYEVVVTDRT